jgi:hypothetical protein
MSYSSQQQCADEVFKMRSFRVAAAAGLAILFALKSPLAFAQCPPNSHPVAIYIPGNLRTAHCWCNSGYLNSGGVCVRMQQPTSPPAIQARPSPNGGSINPVR